MADREFTLKRIRPLSAFRVGLAYSLVGLAAWLLAITVVWFVLDAAGVVEQVNSLIFDVGGDVTVSFGMVLSVSILVGAIVAVLITILAPLLALIYNAIADLFGGLVLKLVD